MTPEMVGRQLEMLKEVLPKVSRGGATPRFENAAKVCAANGLLVAYRGSRGGR